jgi:hypothetical protein
LDKHLKDIGFKPTKADECLYTYDTDNGKMILSVHIDDMLLSSLNKKQQMRFGKEMSKSFNMVKQYDTISYLGMMISKNPTTGSISLSQEGMLNSLLLTI